MPWAFVRRDRPTKRLRPLDVSEFLKAEAALTCKSLLLRRPS